MVTMSEKNVAPSMRPAATIIDSADVGGGVGLARDALHGRGGETTDARGATDDRETGTEAGGEVCNAVGVHDSPWFLE